MIRSKLLVPALMILNGIMLMMSQKRISNLVKPKSKRALFLSQHTKPISKKWFISMLGQSWVKPPSSCHAMGWVRQARSWYIYVYCCINLFVFPPLVVFSFSAFNLYMPAQMSNQWVWTPNEIKLICLSYARSALILSHSHSLLSFISNYISFAGLWVLASGFNSHNWGCI